MTKNGDFVTQSDSIYYVITQVGRDYGGYSSIILCEKHNKNYNIILATHSANPGDIHPLVTIKDLEVLAEAIKAANWSPFYKNYARCRQFIRDLAQWWIIEGQFR